MIHESWQSYLLAEASRAGSPPLPAATSPGGTAPSSAAPGTSATGIAWLPELTVAAFAGPDVLRFLQGYLTCDTSSLDASRLTPAAICNLKGRVVVNGWCLAPTPERVLFVIHESLFARLADLLKPYLRFSRTQLADQRDALLVFGGLGLGPAAGGIPLDAARQLFLCDSVAQAAALWNTHPHLDDQGWQARLIADGLPIVSGATSDAFLPQMLNLPELGAISFSKGCYLGQEVVARAQHRGQVKRHLARLAWRGPEVPAPGAELHDADGRGRATVVQGVGSDGAGTVLAVVQDESRFPLRLGATDFTPAP